MVPISASSKYKLAISLSSGEHADAKLDRARILASGKWSVCRVQFPVIYSCWILDVHMRIECPVGRYLGSKPRTRSRREWCRYPSVPCHLGRTRWLVISGCFAAPVTHSNICRGSWRRVSSMGRSVPILYAIGRAHRCNSVGVIPTEMLPSHGRACFTFGLHSPHRPLILRFLVCRDRKF